MLAALHTLAARQFGVRRDTLECGEHRRFGFLFATRRLRGTTCSVQLTAATKNKSQSGDARRTPHFGGETIWSAARYFGVRRASPLWLSFCNASPARDDVQRSADGSDKKQKPKRRCSPHSTLWRRDTLECGEIFWSAASIAALAFFLQRVACEGRRA